MNKIKEKVRESLSSVLSITVIVFVLCAVTVPLPVGTMLLFLAGAALMIIGMGLFSLGADLAMLPIGDGVGTEITRSKKLWVSVLICFLLGAIVTLAEPDLQVLAANVPVIPGWILMSTVGVGVGIFLAVALLRMVFRVSLSRLLIGLYLGVFVLLAMAPESFVAVAFDSGGVTTGPITVPFIMSLGVGMVSIRHDESSQEDSFGLVALCSVGPILAVLLLGILFHPSSAAVSRFNSPQVTNTIDLFAMFLLELPKYIKEVGTAILPIVVFFAVFQFLFGIFKRWALIKVCVGLIYTCVGLILFLTGVNVGFMPVGYDIGFSLAAASERWLLLPLGLLIGYSVVDAEPAIHVLNRQVEEITGGMISRKAMHLSLAWGSPVRWHWHCCGRPREYQSSGSWFPDMGSR